MSLKTPASVEERKNLRVVYGACPHDCPDTCALETRLMNRGGAVSVRGRADHPVTRGWLCAKVNRYLGARVSSRTCALSIAPSWAERERTI